MRTRTIRKGKQPLTQETQNKPLDPADDVEMTDAFVTPNNVGNMTWIDFLKKNYSNTK